MGLIATANDTYLVAQFVKRLVRKFEEWPAFKLGIIDTEGNVLKKKKQLKTDAEKAAWGYYDILLCNLKKLLAKIPGGGTRLASIAAASVLLLKEQLDEDLMEEALTDLLNSIQTEQIKQYIKKEDVAANNIGTGNIADPNNRMLFKKKKAAEMVKRIMTKVNVGTH